MTSSWNLHTEADVQAAIDQRLVYESHSFDAKKQPPAPTKNLDIAVDLASFAVDGGRILYGIRQPKGSTGPTIRAPFDITGLAERLDQIARGIDRPLQIRCQPIESVEQPGLGYVLVTIPASPDAPHMVDGKYRGRGDTTNIVLSDAEVLRLHEARGHRGDDLQRILDREVARDPTSDELRTQGHMFVVGQPLSLRRDLLSRVLHSARDWRTWLNGPFRELSVAALPEVGLVPALFGGTSVADRTDGYALHSYEMGPDRATRPNGAHPTCEDHLLDLEVRDDGGVRLFCARASYEGRNGQVVFASQIVTLTRRVILAARAIAEKADYFGGWGFGVAIRGIGRAAVDVGPIVGQDTRTVADYERITTASLEELAEDSDAIVKRLLRPFFRGLGMSELLQ